MSATVDHRYYQYDYRALAEDIVSMIHNNRRGGRVSQAEVERVESMLIYGPYCTKWPEERAAERAGSLPRPLPLPTLPRPLVAPSLPRPLVTPVLPRPLAPPPLPRILAPLK